MESGISASAELKSAFQSFLSDLSQRFLLITIPSESIEPLTTIPSRAADFTSDLSLLAPHVSSTAALYIILRQDTSSPNNLTHISYIPLAAPVRQKTLFASSQRRLLKDLGPELFSSSFFATEPAELTAEGWARHEAHEEASAPLTREEQDQQGLRAIEALEQGGTGRRGAGYGTDGGESGGAGVAGTGGGGGSSGVSSKVGAGVVDALSALGDAAEAGTAGRLLQLKIDVQSETIQVVGTTEGVDASALSSAIAQAEPRYSFYSYANPSVADGAPRVVVMFVYTCPTASRIKERMLYASSRAGATALAERQAGLTLAKKLEFSDPSDVTADALAAEFAPKAEEKKAFAKPKRPGRR